MSAEEQSIVVEPRPAPPRWVLPTSLVPIVGVLVCGWIAGGSWAALLEDGHPLVLIALSPINRFLLLATNDLDALPYFGVGLGRHLLPDPFFYLIGFWYGARALRWAAEGNGIVTRLVGEDGHGLEDPAHRKILYPLAFVMPNNWVSMLCGAARIPIPVFAALNITGTLTRLVLCRWLGRVWADEIRDIADYIGRNQRWITIVSVIVVVGGMVMQLRPNGQIRRLARLDDEPDV